MTIPRRSRDPSQPAARRGTVSPRLPGAPREREHSERGSSVVEFVIVAPALMLMVALIVAGGRLALAQQAVESSAAQAARTASIARTQADAATTAHAAAQASLHAQGARCTTMTVTLDTSGFATPVGTPATVGATVTCTVDLAGLLPQLPGSLDVTATVHSPLDTYRER